MNIIAWGATARGTYGTPEAGTCTPYVQYVGPGGRPPCASGTYPTREAGTRSPHVPNGGPGAYASAQIIACLRANSVASSTETSRAPTSILLPTSIFALLCEVEYMSTSSSHCLRFVKVWRSFTS